MNARNYNNFNFGSMTLLLAAAMGVMAFGSPASACDEHQQPSADESAHDEHIVVLNVLTDDDEGGAWVSDDQDKPRRSRGRSFNRVFVTEADSNGRHEAHEVKVEVGEDGEANVWIDGDKVPADRMRREGGRIIVLDKDGNEIRSVRVWTDDERGWMRWRHRDGMERGQGFSFEFDGEMDIDVAPPPVMLGVYMETPGPALCRQLKLDEKSSTLVTGVYDGLSADRAGIKVYDIIVSIDGNDDAGPAKLRAILRDKEPGSTIALGVLHEGEQHTVNVELDAFDRELMRESELHGQGAMNRRGVRELVISPFPKRPNEPVFVAPDMDDVNVDAREIEKIVREAIRNAMRHTENLGQFNPEDLHRRFEDIQPDVEQHMERLHRRMMEMERMLQRMERRMHRRQGGGADDHDVNDNNDDA